MSPLLALLRRGAVSGCVAGVVSGGFSLLLAEPIMDRAVRLETAREAADDARMRAAGLPVEHHAEVFARSTQHAGLLVATTVTGAALGVIFGVVYALLRRGAADRDPWGNAVRLAAVAFAGVWLLPFVRYPANPPGVGDPGTVGERTAAWLAAIAVGVLTVALVWRVHAHLAERGTPVPLRQLAGAGLLVAGVAALFVLPDNPDPVDVPATLLWNFRLFSLAASVLLWGGLGVVFGLLGWRAAQRETGRAAGGTVEDPVPAATR